jgi:Putative zinc-finger
MTPNDSEMDVLLRRFAKVGSDVKSTQHLDADELNAFAEGALPPAARSRYVSHLADCDDCRRVVSGLAAASGRVQETAVPASQRRPAETWWQRIGGLFAPSRLRYAAFAAVLIAVAGIGYTVWRQSHETPAGLVSPSERVSTSESTRAPQSVEPTSTGVAPSQSPAIAKNVTQATPGQFLDQKQTQSSDVGPPPPPKPADVLTRNETAPSTGTTTRAAEPSANAAAPSYAPPPKVETERADTRSREQQDLGYTGGPRRGESTEKYKALDDRSRGAGDLAKARDEDRARTGSDQPVTKEESKDVAAARKRPESRTATLASRPAQSERQEAPKSDKAGPPEETDTRTVGGRKFKRQGNAWIDLKLKSSMSIQTISRGSEDFDKLDSGLRSIAQQFGGPVVVVWKGKAYRIQ